MTHTNPQGNAAVKDTPESLPAFGPLMLGCGNFGGPTPTGEAISIIEYALEHGIVWFDTAGAYHQGESERLIGRFLNGPSLGPKPKVATKAPAPRDAPARPKALAEHFGRHVHQSLERLGADRLALLQIDWSERALPAPKAAVEVMAALIDAGLIQAWGLTTTSAPVIDAMMAAVRKEGLPPPITLQAPYSLFDRQAERRLIPLTRKHGLKFLAWGALGSGFLTAGFGPGHGQREKARWAWHAERGDLQRALGIKKRLETLAGEKNMQPACLATAWCIHQPWVDSVIIGPRTLEHMRDVLAARKILFSPDELLMIDYKIPRGSHAMPFLIPDNEPENGPEDVSGD